MTVLPALRMMVAGLVLVSACSGSSSSSSSSSASQATTAQSTITPSPSTGPVTTLETAPSLDRPTTRGTGTTSASATTPDPATTPDTATSSTTPLTTAEGVDGYYATVSPGGRLPTEQACAAEVLAQASNEVRTVNDGPNHTTVDVRVDIDGADERWNEAFAPRVTGNFQGTTEQILRWGACKWGFDEDITRARAVTESSWRMTTKGDTTDDSAACDLLGLSAPCAQSYGLLQVKGTVHEGTYPASTRSSAFGVDYAMAWLRSCYEGGFSWLVEFGHAAGDEWGCVGTWFSGNWWDQEAKDYVDEVRRNLDDRAWDDYGS